MNKNKNNMHVPDLTDDEVTAIRFAQLRMRIGVDKISEYILTTTTRIIAIDATGMTDISGPALAKYEEKQKRKTRVQALTEALCLSRSALDWKQLQRGIEQMIDEEHKKEKEEG